MDVFGHFVKPIVTKNIGQMMCTQVNMIFLYRVIVLWYKDTVRVVSHKFHNEISTTDNYLHLKAII